MALYALGLISAAWITPGLQKVFPFRPRWRHGLPASPMGMTGQAAVVLSLSLIFASKHSGIDMRYALWLFLTCGAFCVIVWANDAAADRERR